MPNIGEAFACPASLLTSVLNRSNKTQIFNVIALMYFYSAMFNWLFLLHAHCNWIVLLTFTSVCLRQFYQFFFILISSCKSVCTYFVFNGRKLSSFYCSCLLLNKLYFHLYSFSFFSRYFLTVLTVAWQIKTTTLIISQWTTRLQILLWNNLL